MPCQPCPGSKKMVEAHVVPEGFFRRMDQSTETLRILSRDSFPKRIPAGIYDKGILCEGCEPRFGQWDTYAQELLTDENGRAMPQIEGDEIVGYEISAEDRSLSAGWKSRSPMLVPDSPGGNPPRVRKRLVRHEAASAHSPEFLHESFFLAPGVSDLVSQRRKPLRA